MKLAAEAGALNNALSLVAAVARTYKKPPAAVRLIASDAALTISCSTGNLAIATSVAAIVDEVGAAAVSDRLAMLVSGFAAGAIVELKTTDRNMAVACENNRSRLPLLPRDDLPAMLAIDEETGRVEVSSDDCLRLLEPISAVGTETTRYFLCGICWHDSGDGQLIACATDGARLIKITLAAGGLSSGKDLIVPTPTAELLRRLLRQTTLKRVTLSRSRSLINVATPAFSFTSRLIAATYPSYELTIPKKLSNSTSIDRGELRVALDRLDAVAVQQPAPLVALAWGGSETLSVFLARQPNDARDSISASAVGAAEIAIPLRQLSNMLNEFASPRLRFETDDGQPLLIQTEDEVQKLALIMRCQWNFNGTEVAA
jgi:DNA polymerase III subunit beta